jgi:outer membrane receptor protein involved in Fe transport
MLQSPKLQLSLTGNFDQPVSHDLKLVGNVLVAHTSEVVFAYSAVPGTLPNVNGPGYWLVNARIGVATADEKYRLDLVADNLFNTAYYVAGTSQASANAIGWGNPRIIRAELSLHF